MFDKRHVFTLFLVVALAAESGCWNRGRTQGVSAASDDPPTSRSDPASPKGSIKVTIRPISDAPRPSPAPTPAAPAPAPAPPPRAAPKEQITYTGRFPGGVGKLSGRLKVAGKARQAVVYVPARRSGALLITLHGTNDDPERMLTASGAKELADSKGVVVVSPAALKMRTGDWDHPYGGERYWDSTSATAQNADLLFIRAIIAEAVRAYSLDASRVYLLGHSNGGFFALHAAMAMPHRIAAFAENAAGLVRCARSQSCKFKGAGRSCSALRSQPGFCACKGTAKPAALKTSGRKVPGYLSHSSDDPVVSVVYTCTLAKEMQALGYKVSVNIWKGEAHGMPYPLAGNAWPFLSRFKAP